MSLRLEGGLERVLRKFGVNGAGRTRLAAEQIKPIDFEGTEFHGFKLCDGAAQSLQRGWFLDARESEVRAECPVLRRDPEGRQAQVNIFHQGGQRVSAVEPGPKHARMMGIGKPSEPL